MILFAVAVAGVIVIGMATVSAVECARRRNEKVIIGLDENGRMVYASSPRDMVEIRRVETR